LKKGGGRCVWACNYEIIHQPDARKEEWRTHRSSRLIRRRNSGPCRRLKEGPILKTPPQVQKKKRTPEEKKCQRTGRGADDREEIKHENPTVDETSPLLRREEPKSERGVSNRRSLGEIGRGKVEPIGKKSTSTGNGPLSERGKRRSGCEG